MDKVEIKEIRNQYFGQFFDKQSEFQFSLI